MSFDVFFITTVQSNQFHEQMLPLTPKMRRQLKTTVRQARTSSARLSTVQAQDPKANRDRKAEVNPKVGARLLRTVIAEALVELQAKSPEVSQEKKEVAAEVEISPILPTRMHLRHEERRSRGKRKTLRWS